MCKLNNDKDYLILSHLNCDILDLFDTNQHTIQANGSLETSVCIGIILTNQSVVLRVEITVPVNLQLTQATMLCRPDRGENFVDPKYH